MKKKGFNPFILLESTGDDSSATVIGGGTGIGGDVPSEFMTYEEWLSSGFQYMYDFNEDGEYSMYEFYLWWSDSGYGDDLWLEKYGSIPEPDPMPEP